MNQSEYVQAKEYALRSLTCLEQSEYQIRQKLKHKKYGQDIIEEVIWFLKKYDFVNDKRYAEQYVASHCHRMNRRQLLDKLYAKGIRERDIDEYLELYQYDEEALLQKAIEKYCGIHDMSKDKQVKKCYGYFLQKGYSYTMVDACLAAKRTEGKEIADMKRPE